MLTDIKMWGFLRTKKTSLKVQIFAQEQCNVTAAAVQKYQELCISVYTQNNTGLNTFSGCLLTHWLCKGKHKEPRHLWKCIISVGILKFVFLHSNTATHRLDFQTAPSTHSQSY